MNSTGDAVHGDILIFEVCGPDQLGLTLVDTPPLPVPKPGCGGPSVSYVIDRTKLQRYEMNANSIILAISQATKQSELQDILDIAKQFGPNRERTLGTITHPKKIISKPREEDGFIRFIKSSGTAFPLGWHVLSLDGSANALDTMELDSFQPTVSGDGLSILVGIESLRHRLSKLLLGQMKQGLPSLITEAKKVLSDNKNTLRKLGRARSTIEEQRGHLVQIASQFEAITRQALVGTYSDEFFGEITGPLALDHRRLRGIMILPKQCGRISTNPYLQDWIANPVTRERLEKEIRERARYTHGFELRPLVGDLFKDQLKPWHGLAQMYLRTAWESVNEFLAHLLGYVADENTCQAIRNDVLEPAMEGIKERLSRNLEELSFHNSRAYPVILENRLGDLLNRTDDLGETGLFASSSTWSRKTPGDRCIASRIIDLVQEYYNTVITVYTENIAMLAIENCLLLPLETIFTSKLVCQMGTEQVIRLASEPASIQHSREALQKKVEKLQACLKICSRYDNSSRLLKFQRNMMKQESSPSTPGVGSPGPIESMAQAPTQQVGTDISSSSKRPLPEPSIHGQPAGKRTRISSSLSGSTRIDLSMFLYLYPLRLDLT
ncbi:hypothetical protein BJX76DRAFT_356335 [Aspergillus varians]